MFSQCTADTIHKAAQALKAGHLVAFPTETVYGLGADARNPEAVKRIYEVKGRPSDHPLIVHISSISQIEKWAVDIPEYAKELGHLFWPGPMTLILKRNELVGDFITGGQDTVGLRVPSDPIAKSLILHFEKITNSAIAAPSANRFGQVSPTSYDDVKAELGNFLNSNDIILNGGQSTIGIESTIIDCTSNSPILLRLGAVTKLDIETTLKVSIESGIDSSQKFSGSFEKHYAPQARVILDEEPNSGDGFFAMNLIPTPLNTQRLGTPKDENEFAKYLYGALREADVRKLKRIVVIQPKGEGLAAAIRDRLSRASKGR